MAEKKFLSWVGFKEETPVAKTDVSSLDSSTTGSLAAQGSQSNIARIRELENQLAELRSRRDITSLTKEEFEILASETAMSLIKTAQSREARAVATAQKALSDSSRSVKELLESSEQKAKAALAQAESRGRKYIEAAQADAEVKLAEALKAADHIIATKKREASALVASAKQEAEDLISGASNDVADYRGWLSTAIAEAERLHRIQVQSLSAAEHAITQTRGRLATAFEKLASLQVDINDNLSSDNLPKSKNYTRNGAEVNTNVDTIPVYVKKSAAKKAVAKKTVAKQAPKKTAKKTAKKVAKKVAKKSSAKRK